MNIIFVKEALASCALEGNELAQSILRKWNDRHLDKLTLKEWYLIQRLFECKEGCNVSRTARYKN